MIITTNGRIFQVIGLCVWEKNDQYDPAFHNKLYDRRSWKQHFIGKFSSPDTLLSAIGQIVARKLTFKYDWYEISKLAQ